MNLLRAGAFILLASARNRLLRQLRRLRQPRYLVATVLGVLYFWAVVLRWLVTGFESFRVSEAARPVAVLAMVAISLLTLGSSWLFGGDPGALEFSEAEVQFLFTAPARRRWLLHYKLVRSGVLTLFGAAATTFFVGRRITAHPIIFAFGTWIGYATMAFHGAGASLARASLAEQGLRGARRQLASFVVLAGFAVAIFWLVRSMDAPPDLDLTASLSVYGPWAQRVLDTPPLDWILWPVLAPIRMAMAQSAAEMLPLLPGALLVLVAHYLWVLTSKVRFEEASIELAAQNAQWVKNWHKGRTSPLRRSRPLFRLAASGRGEVALLWKNLLAASRGISVRAWLLLLGGAAAIALELELLDPDAARFPVVTAVCAAGTLYLALLGPQVLRIDLRQDLAHVEVLRAWPLSGAQIVRGELLAPWLLLTAGQWLLLALGTALSSGHAILHTSMSERFACALALGFLLPAITAGSLVIQNLAALLFPAWISAERRSTRGVEAVGQRLLILFGNLLLLVIGLLPATLVFSGVSVALATVLKVWALPVASAAGAAVLLWEASLVVRKAGPAFERLEVGR